MGVQGWNRILREEGYVPETAPCCSTSLWRSPDDVMDSIGAHLEQLPAHSELLVDGNGLAFFWYRVAYARHVANVTNTTKKHSRQRHTSSSCFKLGKNGQSLSHTQVRRLIPNFLPLSQLSAVVHEFVVTLRDKHRLKITVYWDGEKRRVYKRETDQLRQERRPEERSNLKEYCETGIPPAAATVCAWERVFPKNRLFKRQIMHTLENMQVPSVYCDEEADAIIAKAARGNPRAYILGMDSDFCFFPDVQYIPLNTLDAQRHTATAVVLRRKEIAAALGLARETMMTELAILLGNDYIHPDHVKLDYSEGGHVHDILNFLRQKEASFVVTSISEDVEESLRFVRSLYELEDLEEYPFESDAISEDDEAGDEIVHLAAYRNNFESGRISVPREMPLDLCVVNPLLDTSAKDAVLRCLERYLDLNLEQSLVTREHIEVLRKLPLDSSQAHLLQQGDWRPQWEDVPAAFLIEKLLSLVYQAKSAVTRLLPPFAVFDQHKFHALLHLERGGSVEVTKPTNGVTQKSRPVSQKRNTKPEKIKLPVDEHEERILTSIKKNRVTIIQGETGW